MRRLSSSATLAVSSRPRAARALARRFDDAFRPLGLTNGQFSLMMSLNRPEPPPMAAVAPLLAMDQTHFRLLLEASRAPRSPGLRGSGPPSAV